MNTDDGNTHDAGHAPDDGGGGGVVGSGPNGAGAVAPVVARSSFRPRLYLAGPIGHGPAVAQNVLNAIHVAQRLTELGFTVTVPHLSCLWQFVHPREYEAWLEDDFSQISTVDAVYRMEGVSPGADREIAYATALGLDVLYTEDTARTWVAQRTRDCRAREKQGAMARRVASVVALLRGLPTEARSLGIRDGDASDAKWLHQWCLETVDVIRAYWNVERLP